MARDDFVDQLARQASELFRAPNLPPDLEHNLRSLLQNGVNRMNLVSRDEFDAQTAVLARSRQRLEALEKQLKALETTIAELENNAG